MKVVSCLTLIGLFLIGPAAGQFTGVRPILSEIFPSSRGGSDAGEFVELYNPTGQPFVLDGYKICDETESQCTNLFGTIPVDSYYVLCRDISQHMRCNIGTRLFLQSIDGLVFVSPTGIFEDQVEWSTQNVPSGSSYVRGSNTNFPLDFIWFPSSSPGAGFLGGPEVTPAPSARPSEDSDPPTEAPSISPTALPSSTPTLSPTTTSPTVFDVCASSPCHPLAACTAIGSSFSCSCPPGYSGNGLTTGCRDIDECSTNPRPCDDAAFCVDSDGSCFSGYTGNGFFCRDINECNTIKPCSSVARCENKPGAFDCFCNAGYTGNGITCTDIDECATGENNCSRNAVCTNTEGSFTCSCGSGFEGDGINCNSLTPAPTPRPSPFPSTKPTPDPSPGPTKASTPPSRAPSRSTEPSISQRPSASGPSEFPSRSLLPSITSFPSTHPSKSILPSITSFPSESPTN